MGKIAQICGMSFVLIFAALICRFLKRLGYEVENDDYFDSLGLGKFY